MKKYLLIVLLTIGTVGVSFGQETPNLRADIGALYSINNTITTEMGVESSKGINNYGVIFGTSISLDNKEGYPKYPIVIMNPNQAIYKKEANYAVYLLPTYRYKRIQIGIKAGVSQYKTFKDKESSKHPLSGNNYLYLKERFLSHSALYGVSAGINITENLKIVTGYDNFNEGSLGIRIKL